VLKLPKLPNFSLPANGDFGQPALFGSEERITTDPIVAYGGL